MATAAEIAQWMLDLYKKQKNNLQQQHAAHLIRKEFGPEWTYRNKNGNWGIVKPVLDEFRKITPDDTVWSRSRQAWRARMKFDPPTGRMVR